MPANIILTTNEEVTVTAAYATVLDRWASRAGEMALAEFTAIYWRDPEKVEDGDLWPAYREALITIDLRAVIAVERVEGVEAAHIERARRHDAAED